MATMIDLSRAKNRGAQVGRTKESKGPWRIQFVDASNNRKSVGLRRMPEKLARSIQLHVEDLANAAAVNCPASDATRKWLAGVDAKFYAKLVAVGLVRERGTDTLGPFLDEYIAKRPHVKPGTAIAYGNARRCLVDFFGADRLLRAIAPSDADEWRIYLITEGWRVGSADKQKSARKLADNTVRRRCGIAKQFFNAAVRKGLMPSNPFSHLKTCVQANPNKFYFLTRGDAQKVLDACPDAQWRLLFALSRFGGLRCPSEHLALRWCHVDWERKRIRVLSPKTEHHVGGESREIPLFPELRPFLEDAHQQFQERCLEEGPPPAGEDWVLTRWRDTATNLRTHMLRIIRRAGLEPWPKLFQNLRSTRETELADQFPLHVVTAWIGNSEAVARKHYLQLRDEHFDAAVKSGADSVHEGAQSTSKEPQERNEPCVKHGPFSLLVAAEDYLLSQKVGLPGFEPGTAGL